MKKGGDCRDRAMAHPVQVAGWGEGERRHQAAAAGGPRGACHVDVERKPSRDYGHFELLNMIKVLRWRGREGDGW